MQPNDHISAGLPYLTVRVSHEFRRATHDQLGKLSTCGDFNIYIFDLKHKPVLVTMAIGNSCHVMKNKVLSHPP